LNRHPDDGDVTTLQQVELGVLGPLQVRQYGLPVAIPGAKPRVILKMLGLNHDSVVAAETLVDLDQRELASVRFEELNRRV
jgi:hypothetical protein